ncbi:MAG: histidine utilization repressor [Tistrella sp.]|uniref:Histidine utilization repressor n=1 Tax=Tistrella mobilis TaxID=171437 RepID=A0A3B9IHX6_9PROT|nr:UTRA domain-containing protein [Tistrella sp.]MAD37252.1 histidine utilization repressor [Tistrella sp.]MBA77907.1 histidine utilization repressor [Tistrella sp.]HAE47350.1 histidine utilization repressor [Tistrella mobilis]
MPDAPAASLHQRIYGDIEGGILDGRLKPGDRIPSEHELMEVYGCSRMTVSKALTALAAAGLIERRRRAGSFVTRPRIERTVMEIQDFAVEAARAGRSYAYEQLSREVLRLTEAQGSAFPVPAGTEVLRLEGLHRIDGVAVALERRLVMLDAVPAAREMDFTTTAPGRWLLQQVPWSDAVHVIGAGLADAPTARLLNLDRGDALLILDRETRQGVRTITQVRLFHPAGLYRFVGRFSPGSAAG